MKIQDIIRGMIDLVDSMEGEEQSEPQVMPKATNMNLSPLTFSGSPGDDINRFKQIVDLADNPSRDEFCNEPNPAYGGVNSVTIHAGGGMNGPKHPADIRVKDPSATPQLISQPEVQPDNFDPTDNLSHFTLINFLRGL